MEPTDTTTHPALVDPRPAFATASATLVEIADAVEPSQLDLPTPTDMTVRELLDHVGMAVGRVTAAGRAAPLETWPTEGFSLGDDWRAALRAHRDEAVEAWSDDRRLGEQIQLPWAVLPGNETLATYVNEVLIHGWDLAQATGQAPTFDDEAVACAEAVMHDQLPTAERGPMWEAFAAQMPPGVPFSVPFADAVPVADDASPIERLVAWNGRQP